MNDDGRRSDTSKHWANVADEPTRKRAEFGPSDPETMVEGKAKERSEPMPGDQIANRYRLERRLGSGGMGDVYLAQDELYNRRVALKLLRRHVAGNLVVVNRFRREARITAQLSNPHAVKVYDFGQADDGSLYLAMEYLEGEAMNSLLEREKQLPQQQVIDIAVDLLHVLTEAHGYGIIHRDIKPANVFLAKGSPTSPAVVKLLDFGIAKLRDIEATELTSSGDVWGTPRYMSPEQARAKGVDQRSDLYSLGVLMYKALTGTFPHEAANAAELAFALLNEVTESPEKRRPDLGISPALGKVVMRALAKEPENRYASASAMAADLRALTNDALESEPLTSNKIPWIVRTAATLPLLVVFACVLEIPFVSRQPFPGFAIESGLLVSALVEESWPGIKQGIQPYDVVVAVNESPVQSGRDVRDRLHDLPVGTPVEYTLRRNEQLLKISVPVSVLSPLILLKQYGSGLLSGLLFAIVGAVVAWRRPQSREAHALVAFTGVFAVVVSSNIDLDLGYFFPAFWRAAMSATSASLLHLALTYPGRWAPLHRKPQRIALLYAASLLLFCIWQFFSARPTVGLVCMQIASVLFVVGGTTLLGRLLHQRIRGATMAIRQSARVLLWGVSVAMLPAITVNVIPIFVSTSTAWLSGLLWLAVILLVFFPAVIAYQLVRGELFDVDVAFSAIRRGFCKIALFLGTFLLPALVMAAVCRALETGLVPQLVVGALAGITTVAIAAEKIDQALRWLFDRRSDTDSAAALDQFAAATEGAESKAEVLESLSDMLRQSFSPNTIQLFERGKGDQYWDILTESSKSPRLATGPRAADLNVTGLMDVPKSGDSVESVRQRVTRLGHWDAHPYLVLPVVGAHETEISKAAPSSVLVIGNRADGRPYSSFHAALAAGLIRLAVLRIRAIEERLVATRQLLHDRCFGSERKTTLGADSEMALDAPARGLAATLLLRFSGLDKASEHLSPRQFKELLDELYQAAAHDALMHGGTLHSLRGDEMLFGFGALGVDRAVTDLDAVDAAIAQVTRLGSIVKRRHASWVTLRCAVSRGLVTVGVFGTAYRQDCLLIGSAIREATELVDAAGQGEVLVDEDIVRLVTITKAPYSLTKRPDLVRGAAVIRAETRTTKAT